MLDKLNILEKFSKFLHETSRTRFGSGFIGAGIAFACFYVILQTKDKAIEECRNEQESKRKELDRLNLYVAEIRNEQRNAFRDGYNLGLSDSQNILERTLDNIDRIKGELGNEKSKKLNEIKKLESEVQKRREVLSDG